MAKEERKGASFSTDDFEMGTGLIQGIVTWRNPRFEMFDYGGKGPQTPAFAIDLEPEEGDQVTQYYSVGNADDWAPNKDGSEIKPIGKADRLSASSNFFQLAKSLEEAGFPKDKMGNTAGNFAGMKCNMVRIAQPERKGLKQAEKKYESTILLVDKIITFPWDAGKKGAGKKAEATEDAEMSVKGTEVVLEILGDKAFMKGYPDGIPKMKLAGEIFKRLKGEKMEQAKINAVVQLVSGKDETFLKEGAWTFEDGVVS